MEILKIKPKRDKDIAWRTVEKEALIVNPKDSLIYPFNRVATRIWELADGGKTVAEIIDEIKNEFDASPETIERDVAEFIENLISKGLLEKQ
ncbi:MAG: PqqD family protein [Candidatus Omnitrophica bacterium]|nr:PqqD family protein [Candidatus Omnitrophota bacterium]